MLASIERLRDRLEHLQPGDRSFAESLIDQSSTRGLSPKQLVWVDRLADRAVPPDPTEKPVVVKPIVDMFVRALGTLKQPKILVDVGDTSLRLSVAGARSSAPGTIIVTSGGGSFEERAYYGRIRPDGSVQFGRDVQGDVKQRITCALVKLAEDPVEAARAYGKRIGRCCFCGLTLTDGPSIHAGYGPICSRKFGLPWGERDAA